ncbi:MAG: ABC transporter substrate-binding protein [Comamonadaceae bacterium]|jgi:molybdate transport system substrate-binding protein|uniref:ABC transporter substrate-binding protein n=1 Tax=Hydrogenophaga borbori TaxID=2294117 RepID=A0A372EQ63_9BURK|nr:MULTISPECIES: substrate-binding domain-containing protein [Hydrogenophaga]NCT96070.1 ABC transporter substrate-binding protein [Comamonadaceae bacterium]RFP82769.1 ABC transporter substrate-binding protein [Hydrogenophaga borbori]WQB81673.1 substrate-binding domain-containing protein [Hydrogenophaga sp. SNF1]
MNAPLTGISSMATRQVLAELTGAYTARAGQAVAIESVGGVDAAKRVAAGEAFDVVILASDAIDKLIAAGHLQAGRVDLVRSGVAACVREGAPAPDLSSEASVKAALLAADKISYSTGPSGVALQKLFERWGIAEAMAAKTVQAPPGVPVASLVAKGEVALGFQQLSELLHVPGIAIVGGLPEPIQIVTVFSAGIPVNAPRAEAVRALLAFMTSPEAAEAKRRQGMSPA